MAKIVDELSDADAELSQMEQINFVSIMAVKKRQS